jgi:hypothetical protein
MNGIGSNNMPEIGRLLDIADKDTAIVQTFKAEQRYAEFDEKRQVACQGRGI